MFDHSMSESLYQLDIRQIYFILILNQSIRQYARSANITETPCRKHLKIWYFPSIKSHDYLGYFG